MCLEAEIVSVRVAVLHEDVEKRVSIGGMVVVMVVVMMMIIITRFLNNHPIPKESADS